MSVRLIDSLATTQPLAELFSDQSVLQAMLDFEVALARAEARSGIIPGAVAEAIAASAKPGNFDAASLAQASLRAGTPAIPLVKALTEHVRETNPDAARFVHWGATSQDAADTAMSLLLRRAEKIVAEDLLKLEQALLSLAEQHEETVMLGRTLLQPAPPVTFGLKAAGWLGAVARGKQDLRDAFHATAVLQFGGASGTLASLGDQSDDRGVVVVKALSEELGFEKPPAAPWHTQRDRLATLACACGVLTGSLGKMARDISLLMQHEVGEASEPGGEGRGGSSTMPHKRNPTACSLTLAAAHRVPGLVASFLSAMVQEHERAVGGWQAEWPIIAGVVQSTGLAIASMAEVAEGISLDAPRMRENIERTNGVIFAERAMMLLGAKVGRDAAHTLLETATKKSVVEGRRLAAVLSEMPEVTAHLDAAELECLEIPEQYLGSADAFRKALIFRSGSLESDRRNTGTDEEN
jgi:3-carboxy-cis,cis-muconate cycloisomerase